MAGYNNFNVQHGQSPYSGAPGRLPLPSELISSQNQLQSPPAHIYSEDMPAFGPYNASLGASSVQVEHGSFAEQANELINLSLNRKPGGTSVVEPDSILGESGRLYHGYKDGKYFLPNDAAEQERLDLQHKVFLLVLDDWLHLAPLTTVPNNVLDIATGTGIWAHDFAERYPTANVIGTDLSAIQPDPRVPNLSFIKDDAEAPWLFPAAGPGRPTQGFPHENNIKFDYVHLRLVVTCFDDPRVVMRHAYDNMSAGGWIEFQDVSFAGRGTEAFYTSPVKTFQDGCIRGAASKGRDLLAPEKYKQYLEEVGFVDVVERVLVLPCSPWPKDKRLREVGLYNLQGEKQETESVQEALVTPEDGQNILEGYRGIGWKMLRAAGHSPEEVETIIQGAMDHVPDLSYRIYTPLYVVYGRKPGGA